MQIQKRHENASLLFRNCLYVYHLVIGTRCM